MAKNEKSAAAEKIQAAEKVKAKKPKSDKPNIFVRAWQAIVRFFRDMRGETKKIIWPDGKTVFKSTLVVLAVITVFTILIGLIDLGLSKSIDGLSNVVRGANESVTETVDEEAAADTLTEDVAMQEEAAADEAAAEEVVSEVVNEAATEAAVEATTATE